MADGEVHVGLIVAGRGDGEQRGDRSALDDVEVVIDQAPLDVLGKAEALLDLPPQLREPHDLRIRQRRLILLVWLDRLVRGAARRRRPRGDLLGGHSPGDHDAIPHLVDVTVHEACDDRVP